MKSAGSILLGIWLIGEGLMDLANLHFNFDRTILASFALAAGALLLIHTMQTKIQDLGTFLLSLWLLFSSSLLLFNYSFPQSEKVLAILGICCGVLLLSRK